MKEKRIQVLLLIGAILATFLGINIPILADILWFLLIVITTLVVILFLFYLIKMCLFEIHEWDEPLKNLKYKNPWKTRLIQSISLISILGGVYFIIRALFINPFIGFFDDYGTWTIIGIVVTLYITVQILLLPKRTRKEIQNFQS